MGRGLILAGKTTSREHKKDTPALLTNIRPWEKSIPGRNAPAYFASLSVARDMTLATGANVI